MSDNQQQAVTAVAAAHDSGLMMGFQNLAAFEFMQRVAKGFALSTMVPAAYQAVVSKGYGRDQKWEQNPAALSNCMVALDLAQRMGASPLQVMQNLHVIEGRPSWSSSFIIALINNSGLYAHNLRFRFEWLDEVDAMYSTYEWQNNGQNNVKTEVLKTVRVKNARCVAWTKDKSGELIESPEVTIEMAVAEGWYTRNGSKWRTMTQLMCQYRAAAFFGRTYNPELLMGLPSTDEMHDIIDVVPQADGTYAAPPVVTPEAGAPEAPTQAPRPPRAKQPTADVTATPTPTPDAAPAPAPEPEQQPAAAAPEPSPAPADKPGVDMETGEVLPEAAATTPADEQRIDSLFDEATAPTPAAEPTPAPAVKKTTPKPAAKDATAAATSASTTGTVKAPAAPALTPQKIAFVKAQLDTTGGWTTADFTAKFRITPDALTVPQFPDVLAWFKQPKPPASA